MKKRIFSLLALVCMIMALLSANIITAFAYDGTQYGDYLYYTISNGEITITDCASSATAVEIPAEINGYPVTSIGKDAFWYCTSLTSVTIPDSITSIGINAFNDCTSLRSITIPNSVTSIDSGAFYNTGYYNNDSNWENDVLYIENYLIGARDTITSCEIKPGTKLIADDAFHSSESLESITIPDSVTSIGNGTFCYCYSLESITIPDSVTSIDSGAFFGCISLTSVTIPSSVTSIGERAFDNCDSLTSINVEGNNKNYSSADGVLFNKDKTCLISYPGGKNQNEYVIPDGVTNIAAYAFGCCTNLKNVIIPDSVTSIGNHTFSDCTSLTSVTIPDSVTSIGSSAFYNTGYYNNDSNWENDVLYIGNYLIGAKYTITSCEIKSGTKLIADSTFGSCVSLISVTIPDSVTSISDGAFSSCISLRNITIPKSVTNIGDSAFYNCQSLASITIPDSVTSIGSGAFFYCDGLASITIPDSVTSIGYQAFGVCISLTSITIPSSVISIGSMAFYDCVSLTSINVEENNKNYSSVDGVLFNKDKTCLISYPKGKEQNEYVIPDGVTNIDDRAFHYCINLKDVIIPDTVTSIGEYAFYNGIDWNGQISVYYEGSEEDWGKIDIKQGNSVLNDAEKIYNEKWVETAADNTIVLKIGDKKASVFGEEVENDVAPIIRNDRTMLPIRFIAEALGAEVEWDGEARKVTISTEDIEIVITIDSDTAVVNGESVKLDSPAFIENDRTYLPVRFISENLGAKVTWNEATKTVTITK